VIAPSAVWATAVSVSRLHLGVHYPSDVLAGAVLGAGIATAVHLLRDAITPSAFAPDSGAPRGPSMTLRVRF
jgi:membrane-associated phospholipid phosphatase